MQKFTDKQELNRGFGDGLARAFEMVATPFLFALLGFGLDHLFNTKPIFVITFAAFGVVGMFAREWFVYNAKMRAHEKGSVWAKR